MTRVALKGILSRRMRTALTMFAIVLGVAMVAGAYTLTDTMLGAADSLSSAAYDGTDAVVTKRQDFQVSSDDDLRKPPVDASVLGRVRAVRSGRAARPFQATRIMPGPRPSSR